MKMNKSFVTFIALGTAIVTLHAFKPLEQSTGIKGSINPADGASMVWGINGTDTIKAVPANGVFALTAKAGTWQVIVDAKDPYKDAMLDKVEVKEGELTDLGVVKLTQ